MVRVTTGNIDPVFRSFAPTQALPFSSSSDPTPKRKDHGWICPKCDNVYAPSVEECKRCNFKSW